MEWLGPIFLFSAWLMGVALARHNLKVLKETKPQRLEARRKYKKKKNEALRKLYGLDKREN